MFSKERKEKAQEIQLRLYKACKLIKEMMENKREREREREMGGEREREREESEEEGMEAESLNCACTSPPLV
jgi:hypothetical protein